MLEWKKRNEKNGYFYANLMEVQHDPECSAAWKVKFKNVWNVYVCPLRNFFLLTFIVMPYLILRRVNYR